MSEKYLLPCPCGQHIVIEPRQAGEMVVCACGAAQQAPTMLGITSLEPAPPEDSTANKSHWGAGNRLLLLGMAFVFAALVGAVVLHRTRPIPPSDVIEPEQIHALIDKFTPTRTWEIWESMKFGLGRTDQRYLERLRQHRVWLGVAAIAAVAGGVLIFFGATLRRAPPKPPAPDSDAI